MQTIGEKIALLVKARGWQQKEFADSIGYSAEHFSRLLKTDPLPAKALRRIAKGLDILPEHLSGLEVIGRGVMPGGVSEPDALYRSGKDAKLPGGDELEFLRGEIGRLHTEIERLGEQLTREQALSASLAEALNHLAQGKNRD